MSLLKNFLQNPAHETKLEEIAYLANLDQLLEKQPEIGRTILEEYHQQNQSLKMIASENYSSLGVQLAMSNLFTDKYAEGFVGHRFYAGCDHVDTIESLAEKRARQLFPMDTAYVQPHSGADANLVAFLAVLHKKKECPFLENIGKTHINQLQEEDFEKLRTQMINETLLGMALDAGGHLTHGSKMNISSKIFKPVTYGVDPKTLEVDYNDIARKAREVKPLILLAGYSAYPRLLDFSRLKEIAQSVGATLMVDMAHFAGLVAGKAITGNFSPVGFADILTTTTHKTLRGPRGGMILASKEYAPFIQKGCPYVLGGPLEHVIAAKAVAFKEALDPSFQKYAQQIILNAKTFAEKLMKLGFSLTTKGTDNHLVIIDITKTHGLTGMQAEKLLESIRITVNRNSIPFDKNGAWFTSGIRMGTPALTSRGFTEDHFQEIAAIIHELFKHAKGSKESKTDAEIDEKIRKKLEERVKRLLQENPLYPTLGLTSRYAEI